MLKFILDVGVGKKVQNYLENAGYDTISVIDLDNTMLDTNILFIAEKENRIVITMDKDFGELVYRSKQSHNGVLLLRLEDANGTEKAEVVSLIIEQFANEIEGKFAVFQHGRLRIRS
jgi:predicted nuclease of predicted toxin-antitoxin system